MEQPESKRLFCPYCGHLLAIAGLSPGSWVECLCKPCKHKVRFEHYDDEQVLVKVLPRD